MTPTHRPGDRVVWLLGRASLQAQRLVLERFAGQDLRKQHYGVLASLARNGPMSQGPLADRLCLDRSDMVTILDDLESRGYVQRTPHATDRRRKIVQITRAGEVVLGELDEVLVAADTELLSGLTDEERDALAALLRRLIPEQERG